MRRNNSLSLPRKVRTPVPYSLFPALTFTPLSLVAANSTDYLVRKGITHILTLTSERVTVPAWAGIVHKQFRVRDTRRQNLLQYLLDGVQFVEDAFLGIIPAIAVGDKDWSPSVPTPQPEREVRVFVHCRAGISRSGSVVVAYGIPRRT